MDPESRPPPLDIPGTHRHKCAFCGNVWRHSDSCDLEHGRHGYHECIECGRCNWSLGIYTGPELPG